MKNYILGSLASVVLILALAMPASVPAAPAAKSCTVTRRCSGC